MKVINIKDFCIPAEDASYDELSYFADEIAELATYPIEAEPVRRGRWINNGNNTWSCSQCQSWIPDEQHHYASYSLFCGAKMEEE